MTKPATLLILVLGSFAAFGRGEMTSGGGDATALEFTAIGYEVAGYLKALEPMNGASLPGLTAKEFLDTVQSTLVTSEPRVFVDGNEVGAVNIPDLRQIKVGQERWRDLDAQRESRIALVFHEYLGILRKDDARYQFSNLLLQRMRQFAFGSLESIECRSFVRRPFVPGVQYDEALWVRVSNRSLFGAKIEFKLKDPGVDATLIADRHTRPISPEVSEIFRFKDRAGMFQFLMSVELPDGHEGFENEANLSDIINGQRQTKSFNLHCAVVD